jgi:hypothetical protein
MPANQSSGGRSTWRFTIGLAVLSIGPIIRVSRGVDGSWFVFLACLTALACLASLAAIWLVMQKTRRRAADGDWDVWPGYAPRDLARVLAELGMPLPWRPVGSAEHMVSLRADAAGVSWWDGGDGGPQAFVPWEEVAQVRAGTTAGGQRAVVVVLWNGTELPTRLTGFAIFAMFEPQMAAAAEQIDQHRRSAAPPGDPDQQT